MSWRAGDVNPPSVFRPTQHDETKNIKTRHEQQSTTRSVDTIRSPGVILDRYWFLTWTTDGQWLPGDPRRRVTRVRDESFPRIEHDEFQAAFDKDILGLYKSAQQALKCPPIRLIADQAPVFLEQFQETTQHRGWQLVAVGIMANHIHMVTGVPGDPDPEKLLQSYKSYGSRTLNKHWTKPASDTWWTESGSKRKLADEASIFAAVEYIRNQEYPLLIWINPIVNDWKTK